MQFLPLSLVSAAFLFAEHFFALFYTYDS